MNQRTRPQWAVFISGRGSNLARLLDYRDEIEIRVVVSSAADASGVFRARRAGVPTCVTPMKPGANGRMKIDWETLDLDLRTRGITHICLAGFMKIVPASFIEKWKGKIVNLHPSLLPAYPGLDSIERAHRDGHALGLSVHEVIAAVDEGPLFAQRQTLNARQVSSTSLETAEFLLHLDEQRVLSEVLRSWRRA